MPSELENALARHRRALLQNERAAASEMVRAYGETWARLRVELLRLHAQMALADPAPSMAQVLRDERLRAMQAQVEGELRRFAPWATQSVTLTQAQAVQAAQRNAVEAIEAASNGAAVTGGFNRMNPAAVEALVGYASDGSPLRDLFEALGPEIAPRVTETLAQGVALGLNPRVTARAMREAYGMGLTRALTIARTETLCAYREAAHATYEANDDILAGWIWMCAVSARSCASCVSMHGSVHPLSEKLRSHPNCRCAMAPRLKGVPSPVAPGAARFAALSQEDQRKVLGPGMWEAWKDGRVSLTPAGANSIVGVRQDVRWGTTRYARGLTDMVGAEQAAGYVAKARQVTLGEWTPARADAALVGRVGDAAWAALSERTRVRQVYVVPETWEHIAERHNRDLDVGLARDLLPSILAQPEIIYRSASRPDSLLFAGRYDAQHFLVVVTKALGDEVWLATVYKDRDYNVLKRAQKAGIVYRR